MPRKCIFLALMETFIIFQILRQKIISFARGAEKNKQKSLQIVSRPWIFQLVTAKNTFIYKYLGSTPA
jgi:hypothetical protein